MIISYEQFDDKLKKLVIFRAKNFVTTDCDVNTLIDLVYNDIANDVNLAYDKYAYTISDETLITLPKDNSTDTAEATLYYKDVYDIVDEDDNTLAKAIVKTYVDTYRYISDNYRASNNGKTIYFIRSVVPSIETLDNMMYSKIMQVMIEGIMYHIQASIPDPSDGQVTNLTAQRYFAAKTQLKNSLPQVDYIKKHVKYGDNYGSIGL